MSEQGGDFLEARDEPWDQETMDAIIGVFENAAVQLRELMHPYRVNVFRPGEFTVDRYGVNDEYVFALLVPMVGPPEFWRQAATKDRRD